jgi:hypothetical protein
MGLTIWCHGMGMAADTARASSFYRMKHALERNLSALGSTSKTSRRRSKYPQAVYIGFVKFKQQEWQYVQRRRQSALLRASLCASHGRQRASRGSSSPIALTPMQIHICQLKSLKDITSIVADLEAH